MTRQNGSGTKTRVTSAAAVLGRHGRRRGERVDGSAVSEADSAPTIETSAEPSVESDDDTAAEKPSSTDIDDKAGPGAMPGEPARRGRYAVELGSRSRGIPISWAVILVILAAALLFGWLAWLTSGQLAPWKGGSFSWMRHVTSSQWFDAAQTAAALLAIPALAAVALVLHRRQQLNYELKVMAHHNAVALQDTAVAAQRTAQEAAATAADQLDLDERKYDLEARRHSLAIKVRQDERERELRRRYDMIVGQLNGRDAPLRLAGAYALAALADDWHRTGIDAERQVCVNLLCAQLRTPPRPHPEDPEFRRSVVAILREHRLRADLPDVDYDAADAEKSWRACHIDLTGAVLSGMNFLGTDLSGVVFHGADLTQAVLADTNLTGAALTQATLTGGYLTNADLTRADLRWAELGSVDVSGATMDGALLAGARNFEPAARADAGSYAVGAGPR